MNRREEEKTLERIVSLRIDDFGRWEEEIWGYFGSESWRIRKAAEEVFIDNFRAGRIKKESGYQFLYRGLKDKDNVHRKNASYEVMRELYESFADEILKALNNEMDPDTLKFLVNIVGDVRDERAVPSLKELVKHQNPNVRFSAIESLGKIGSHESIDILYDLLNTSNLYEVYGILEALASIGKRGIRLKIDPVKRFIKEKLLEAPVAEYLGLTSSNAFPLVVELLSRTESGLTVRKCVEGIVDIVERSKNKRRIISELRKLITPEVLNKVFSSYEDAPDDEILYLCKFLGYMDNESAILELVKRLQDLDTEDEARALYLSWCEVDILENIFRKGNRNMLSFVIKMLGILGKKEAEEWIIEEVKRGDREVVSEGIKALAKLGGKKSLEFIIEEWDRLVSIIGEEDFQYVLNEIVNREFDSFIKLLLRISDPPVAYIKAVLSVIKERRLKLPKSLQRKFLSMLDHPDEGVRKEMVAILELLPPQEAVPYVERLIFDESPQVRKGVAEFLGTHMRRTQKFKEMFDKLLYDKDVWVRVTAMEILSQKEPRRFYEMLGVFLKDGEELIREKVVYILKELNPQPDKLVEVFSHIDNAEEVINILSRDEMVADMLKRAGLLTKGS